MPRGQYEHPETLAHALDQLVRDRLIIDDDQPLGDVLVGTEERRADFRGGRIVAEAVVDTVEAFGMKRSRPSLTERVVRTRVDRGRDAEASGDRAGEVRKRELFAELDERQPSDGDLLAGDQPAPEYLDEGALICAGEIERPVRTEVEAVIAARREEDRVPIGAVNARKDRRLAQRDGGKAGQALGRLCEWHLLPQTICVSFGGGHDWIYLAFAQQLDRRMRVELGLR